MEVSNEIKFHQKLISYLLISIPILLITGPFLPDVAVVIICMLYLYNCFSGKTKIPIKNPYFIIFLLFYFVCILSSLFSDYQSLSIFKSIAYIRFLIFSLAIAYILSIDRKVAEKLFFSILLCFVVLIIDGFYQFIFKQNIIGLELRGDRVSSFFKDELIYGSYLSKFLPLFLSLFFLTITKNNKLNLLFSAIFFLSILAIAISGERSSLFMTILILIYLLIMLNLKFKILLTFFVMILIGLSSLLIFNDTVKNRIIIFTKNQIFTKNKIFVFSEDHTGHLLSAIDIFQNNNKLIGIGPKNYRNYCFNNKKYENKPFVCSSHPHNTYIQILIETGIAGFIILVFVYIRIIYLSLKHFYSKTIKKKSLINNFQICLISFYFMILWPLIPTGSFFNNYLSIIYYIPLGFIIWSKTGLKKI